MIRLRNIGILVLAILLLAGTVGVSFSHHICACKPAVVQSMAHSCCASATGCANHHKGCKDVHIYLKVSMVAIPATYRELLPEVTPPLMAVIPFGEQVPSHSEENILVARTERPPPLAGRRLVTYLHQIRIPFSA